MSATRPFSPATRSFLFVFRSSVLTLALALGASGCRPAPNAGNPVVFDAQAELSRWVALWQGYDLAGLEELFVWDSTVTYLSSEREGLIRGTAALREHHAGMGFVEGGQAAEQELWVEDVAGTVVHGSTAVVTAVWYFGDRAMPRDSVQRGPMTVVYRWAEDGYKISHMHFANY